MPQSKPLFIPNNIELIIFDCDGVLVDSEVLSQRVLLSMLNELGVVVSKEYFLTHFLGFNFKHVIAKVFADFSVTLSEEFRDNYRKALITVFTKELQQTDGLAAILAALNVKSCVATSGSPEKVKNSLHCTQLDTYFNGQVFTSSEVNNGKPAPDLFLHAAKKMAVAPQHCLVIEDSNAGVSAALAANMHVIRYVGASHLQNIDISTQPQDNVSTISHWDQFFEQIPSLRSPDKTEE